MRHMKKYLYMMATAFLLIACNNAEYSPLDTHAFINESIANKSSKVIITNEGAIAEVTPCLSSAALEDCSFKLVVDTNVLELYNKVQSTSYISLPKNSFEMDSVITIMQGKYSADAVKIKIKPLTQDMVGETYALPLRLVSLDGKVPTMSSTGTFVITTEAIIVSSLPQFTGTADLEVAMPNGSETYNEYTVEVKFQISNTANRNRAVFANGNGDGFNSVLLRFEDPQTTNPSFQAHSLVQIVGRNAIYMNPTYAIIPNKWQHLALTCNGSQYKMYINGAFAGQKDIPAGPTVFQDISWFSSGTWWNGCKIMMTEARIWSVCRTETQIQNNQATVSSKSKGLEAYWRLNEGKGNSFVDCTGHGHTMTTDKTPLWVPDIKSTDEATQWK